MKIMVLGTLCAGQKTFCNALKLAGYKVGLYDLDFTSIIETPDGAVITVDRLTPSGIVSSAEVVLHLVRNPLFAIPMIRKELGGKTTLTQAADVWYWRNVQIGYRAGQVVRVEDLSGTWPKQLLRPKKFARIRTEVKPLTWKALNGNIPNGDKMLEMAKRNYGYKFGRSTADQLMGRR
jgi:hypothetical protein